MASPNNLAARRSFPGARPHEINAFFYVYSVFFDDLANAGVGAQQVNIQSDGNFVIQHLIFGCQNAAARVSHPDVDVQITDTSSGMTLFDRALPIWMIAGTAELPYLLPTPRVFPASSTISVSATNNDGGARDIYLAFMGQKVQRLG